MTRPHWTDGYGNTVPMRDMVDRAAAADVVLLGEQHDRADIHRWQAYMVAALATRRDVIVGFEMFPARLDPVLAEWVSGVLSEEEFLTRAEWGTVWGFDAELYMPIFRLCRDFGLPMRGLNVTRTLVRAVGKTGWQGVPEAEREGLTPARPSPKPYREFIFRLTGRSTPDTPEDEKFNNFIRAQEVWDRAFATHLARAHDCAERPLVVAIVGMGHIQYGGGVQWQLADLGIDHVISLIPAMSGTLPSDGAADGIWLTGFVENFS